MNNTSIPGVRGNIDIFHRLKNIVSDEEYTSNQSNQSNQSNEDVSNQSNQSNQSNEEYTLKRKRFNIDSFM